MPDAHDHSVPDNGRRTASIEDAADILGLRPEALRKRLQRGQEDGYKANDGRWRVYVPSVQDSSRKVPEIPGNPLDNVLDEVRLRMGEKDALIKDLKAQIGEKDAVIRSLIAKLPDPSGAVQVEALKVQLDDLQLQYRKAKSIIKRVYPVLLERGILGGSQKSAG